MALTRATVGGKITAAIINAIIDLAEANTPGVKRVVPTSVAGSGVSFDNETGVVTFTAASSVSLNGCFTSAYRNYKVVIDATSSVSGIPRLRLRASGSDVTTASSYVGERFYHFGGTMSSGTGTLDYWETNLANNTTHTIELEARGPQLAAVTQAFIRTSSYGGTAAHFTGGFRQTGTSARDGFTFYVPSGTLTGTLKVYGYN